MALDRYGDVLPRSILKPRSAGDGNPVYVALSFADEPDLIRLQDAMRRSGIKAEWQDPGLFHCSLLVVEDATDEQLNGLLDGLSLPVRFWVEVASLGTFEADDIPLIANVVANPALIRLQQEFAAAALRQALPVFEFFRATAYKPHITLGYNSDADIEVLPTLPAIIKLRAEAVLLMRDDYNVVRRILLPETMPDRAFIEAGGKGSGFYGHAGRPGEVGGSLPSGEMAEEVTAQPVDRPCPRCGGTGFIPHFQHVEGGICFDCGGTGLVPGVEGEVYSGTGERVMPPGRVLDFSEWVRTNLPPEAGPIIQPTHGKVVRYVGTWQDGQLYEMQLEVGNIRFMMRTGPYWYKFNAAEDITRILPSDTVGIDPDLWTLDDAAIAIVAPLVTARNAERMQPILREIKREERRRDQQRRRASDLQERGGPGSGFYGHAGIPGHQGGSLPSGEVAEETRPTLSDNDKKSVETAAFFPFERAEGEYLRACRDAVGDIDTFPYTYYSYNRPLGSWASLPDDVIVNGRIIFATNPLPMERIIRLELGTVGILSRGALLKEYYEATESTPGTYVFVTYTPEGNLHGFIVHPSHNAERPWQSTDFDERGFSGHDIYPSVEQAIGESTIWPSVYHPAPQVLEDIVAATGGGPTPVQRGGPGSGFYGHAGIPGHQGGSLPSGEVAEEAVPVEGQRNPWQSLYHRPDGTLDMEAIGRDVARAVAERPSRESHGRTAVNAFFLVNGRIVPWDKWETIPPDEMSQAIAVHSHSADNWQQYRQMHNEGKPETFAPLNSADIALMFRNFTLHRMGAASIIIMGDGRMESLEILPDTDARAVRMREARLGAILDRDYQARLAYHDAHRDDPNYDTNQQERELLHAFANQYALGYQEGRWRADPLAQLTVQRHYGPGPHPGTGTPQSVHGGGGISGEARLVSGIGPRRAGSRARYKAVIAADGITALAVMPQTQTWRPAWEGLEAIDRVHRMPDYMADLLQRTAKPGQLPFERSRSEIRSGGYWQINGDGAKKIGIDLTEAGYGGGEDPPHPQLTTVHEVAHFLDNVLFGDPQTGGRATMGKGARVGPSGDPGVNLGPEFEDVIVAMRESVDYQDLAMQDLHFFTVEGVSGHFEYPARAAMRVIQPVEMFARGYSQWVALRSGNATVRAQIDHRNAMADRGAPRLQWDWRNFEPIAGAYDRLFQAAGLLRSTP